MMLPFVNDLEDVELPLPTPLRMQADTRFTGKGVTIALIDSGFYPHADLTRPRNRILWHVDARLLRPRESALPGLTRHVTQWHGTMTSCVCAGNGYASMYRYTSLAPDAQVVLVRVGQVGSTHITERDIARGLRWVLENASRFHVRVVNIAVGGDIPSTGRPTPLDALVEEVVKQGIVVVCAAGNSGARRIIPPASAASAITVGGVDDRNTLTPQRWQMYHSSFGRGAYGVMKPELLAPAAWLAAPMLPNTRTHREADFLWKLERADDLTLRRLLHTPTAKRWLGSEVTAGDLNMARRAIRQRINREKLVHPHYQHVDGTSFAAAIVSSLAAQMLEANPTLSPTEVKEIMMQTAQPLDDVPMERQGAGVVQARQAIAAALARFVESDYPLT
ncbi:MAG: S8 family serine peptidase [Thermoflexales bacterium]